MLLTDVFADFLSEMDRVHPDGLVDAAQWSLTEDNTFPNFMVAQNGQERFFTRRAIAYLRDIVATQYENDPVVAATMTHDRFGELVRRCFVDLHAAGHLAKRSAAEALSAVNAAVLSRTMQLRLNFTHYFPCWTTGFEKEAPFVLGPVTFQTRLQWISAVDFPQAFKEQYLKVPEENARWKDSLKILLSQGPRADLASLPAGLARTVYHAIDECPSLAKVEINGFDIELSKKVAEIVCKSALDCLSLLLAGRDFYFQNALHVERLPPRNVCNLLETDGQLWLPGAAFTARARIIGRDQVNEHFANNTRCIEAFAHILMSLVAAAHASHPNLAKRWATALDWYAEGQRERNDAVAVAKMGASLDVLSCGGKGAGILSMLENLFGTARDKIVVTGRRSMTLEQVVNKIYSQGRSQVLHGTEFDRLKSFRELRNHATVVGRLALLIAATRLPTFKGLDEPLAFRSISDTS